MRQLLGAIAIGLATASCATLVKQKPLTAYVSESAPGFMEAQQKRFGLCYGQAPAIDYKPLDGLNGRYFPYPNIILLDPRNRTPRKVFGMRMVDEDDLRSGADNTLHHELVHSYIHGLCKTENLAGCAFFSSEVPHDMRLTVDLVNEGAATFIADTMTNRRRDCTKFWKLRVKTEDYSSDKDLVYNAGYCVAREVLGRKKDADKRIRHMLGSLPMEDELRYPYSYAKRMKRELKVKAPR